MWCAFKAEWWLSWLPVRSLCARVREVINRVIGARLIRYAKRDAVS
jgi:hypothetical protein